MSGSLSGLESQVSWQAKSSGKPSFLESETVRTAIRLAKKIPPHRAINARNAAAGRRPALTELSG
jgi:hypothetical protein